MMNNNNPNTNTATRIRRVATATAVLHYLAPNTTTDPTVAANSSVKLVSPAAGRRAA